MLASSHAPLATIRNFLESAAPRPPKAAGAPQVPAKRAAKFKLDDPDVVEGLAKKYAHLAQPGPLYRKIAEGYSVVARILAAPSMIEGAQRASGWRMSRQADTSQTINMAMSNMSYEKRVFDRGGEGVAMQIKLPVMFCTVPGKPQGGSQDALKAHAGALSVMRALFPKFMGVYGSPIQGSGMVEWETEERVLPLESLAAINVPSVPPLDVKSMDAGYRGMVKYALKVSEVTAVSRDQEDRVTEFDDVSITVECTVEVTFPEEYARWATSSAYDEEWAPALFWQHTSQMANWWNNPDSKGAPPAPRSDHPLAYDRMAKKIAQTYVLKPRPMVNDEGIVMVPKGELYWVPDAGSFENHVNTLRDVVDAEGAVDFSKLKNQHVATDWITEKLYITDELGRMKLIDLMGARPLDPATIGHLLDGFANIDMLGRMIQMCQKVGVPVDKSALSYIDPKLGPFSWENFIDVPYFDDETDRRNDRLFSIGRSMVELYTKMTTTSELSPYEQLSVRPYVALFGAYGKRRKEFSDALIAQRAAHAAKPKDTPVTLANLPGVDGIMPHQNVLFNQIDTAPPGAILDVSAGGGKTLAYIFDMTSLMDKGLVKRPMVIMPRNLIAQFANEMTNKFSRGRLKAFAINARVWRTWMKRIGSNPTAARQIIDSMPKNTVFLVDYGWLTQGAQLLVVGDDEVRIYSHALMLAQMGFDYVCLDESQRAKKLKTSRTLAANIVAASAKYRRIGSGTILHNTARDLLGQMSILNPMALGAVGDALKESDRISIDRLPLLRKNVETFARRMKVSRREWAHLLPTLHERVHTVRLTRNQNQFYDTIMKNLAAEVANDPKVRRLLKQQSDQAEAKLESVFKRYLAKVEIWLNAPDSTYNEKQYGHLFKAVPGLTREDLMSPKISAIDQLIEAHFRGGKQEVDGKMEDLPPDPFKIMIVGYNKAVSEHVFAHMHHKALAVHYRAGDDATLDKFKNEDDIKILVADETAMQEGHNMQMVSRIIRLQTLWTPGGQEQLLARMMRPDVPDKNGQIKYARDRVWLDWIVVEPSIEVAKMARLIGKLIENSVIQEIDSNPNLARVVQANKGTFDRIKRIRMNLDFLRDRNLQTVDMLQDQFTAYQVFKGWENGEFLTKKKELRLEIEARVGRKIKPGELGPLSMQKVEVKLDPTLDPGKRLFGIGYTPFIEGFSGFNPTSLHLEPITLPPPEDEDEEGDEPEESDEDEDEENVHVEVGDVVATEFGLGYITRARRGASIVEVQVPGFSQQPVKLKRYNVLGPTTPEDKEALLRLMQQAKQVNLLTKDDKTGQLAAKPAAVDESAIQVVKKTADSLRKGQKTADVKSAVKPGAKAPPLPPVATKPLKGKPVLKTLDMQNVDTTQMVDTREFTVVLYNGVIALVVDEKDETGDAKLARLGFERMGRQVEFQVRSYRAFDNLVEALSEKFYIPRPQKRILDQFSELYTKHRENVAYLKPRAYAFHAAWVRDQKKKATEKNEIRPYPVVSGSSVHVYINAETCPAALKLKGFATPAGVKRPTLLEAGLIKFVATRREAVDVLDKFEARKGKVANRKQVIAELKTIKG